MPEIIELGFLDVNPIVAPITLAPAFIFSGAVEAGKIERAWATLCKAWPIMMAHLRLNEKTGVIEMVIPDAGEKEPTVTSKVIDSNLAQVENIYTKTKTISTQIVERNPAVYRSCPLQDLQAYLTSGDLIWLPHVTYLKDATIFTVTFPHFSDGGGMQMVYRALIGALDGEAIPPLASQHPWSILLPEALRSPSNQDATEAWSVWDDQSVQAFQQAAAADLEATGPIQTRNIYFPAAEIARLRQQAMDEIRKAGYSDVERLSTSDVLSAWFYQRGDKPFHAAVRLLKTLPRGVPAWSRLPTSSLLSYINRSAHSDTQLHAMSFGEVTRLLRLLVVNNAAREPLLSKLKWIHEHPGKFIVPFSPGDRLQIISSWLTYGFGDLNISKHVKPGTGTGRMLEVTGEGSGKGYITLIKIKDADGGVLCEMDWGAKQWTLGEIAKYALENQVLPATYHPAPRARL